MKFLVDAQLPRRFAGWLREAGHDARHTLELPLGNRTPDHALVELAAAPQMHRPVPRVLGELDANDRVVFARHGQKINR